LIILDDIRKPAAAKDFALDKYPEIGDIPSPDKLTDLLRTIPWPIHPKQESEPGKMPGNANTM